MMTCSLIMHAPIKQFVLLQLESYKKMLWARKIFFWQIHRDSNFSKFMSWEAVGKKVKIKDVEKNEKEERKSWKSSNAKKTLRVIFTLWLEHASVEKKSDSDPVWEKFRIFNLSRIYHVHSRTAITLAIFLFEFYNCCMSKKSIPILLGYLVGIQKLRRPFF